jgi:LysR family transcriptional regulator, glycine cleavage system transcriptional activator
MPMLRTPSPLHKSIFKKMRLRNSKPKIATTPSTFQPDKRPMAVSPPHPRSPPLNALRAFEAAARLGGFTAAAQELNVTPGAVTAHIKSLEQHLGAALFERHAQGVRLTALGARVISPLTNAFDQLAHAVALMRAQAQPHAVHLATLPSIAQLWLLPRLPLLREQLPDISISVTALESPADLKRSPYDLNLFFSEGAQGIALSENVIFPVCSPALAARLKRLEDLNEVPCLTDAVWSSDWSDWLAHASKARRRPVAAVRPRGPVFSLYALALDEALAGSAVLVAHACLVQNLLDSGRLVAPFRPRLQRAAALRAWSAFGSRPDSPGARVLQAVQTMTKSP